MPREYPAAIGGSISSGHVLGDSFEAQLDAFIAKSLDKAEEVIMKAIVVMYGEIIETSPVDTGLFRANNQLSVGSIPTGVKYTNKPVKGTTYDAGPTISEGLSKIRAYKLKTVAYICNNLVYSIPLEYGHSSQAPTGIYRKAALRFDSFLSTAAASVKG